MAAREVNHHIFAGAKNTVINGGSFTTVGGNLNINPRERYGLGLLLNNISQGAFYDAAERGNPPKCHPETRKAILDEIMTWIKLDPQDRDNFILWLYGPAGSGKNAICQSIAEACAKEGLLAASFFFGRLAAGRNTATLVLPTIAYQLSRCIPEMEDPLLTAIEKDPTIFSRSLSTQMRVLIIEPLTFIQLSSHTRVVIMDGLDECGPDDRAHAELLKALASAVNELKNTPMIFLIGSRPEYEIRTAFNKQELTTFTQTLALDDKYEPDSDIQAYFNSEFRKIREDLLPSASELWPADSDIDILVQRASGQFIFASTVIRFVDSPRHHPAERLNIILGLSHVGNETPFALLDTLYRFILSNVADIEKVLQILTYIILSTSNDTDHLSLAIVNQLLGFDVHVALVDMHSLVFVPPSTTDDSSGKCKLRIHHASLYDFLTDCSRSLEFYIDASQGHVFLSRRWLNIITNYNVFLLSRQYLDLPINVFIYHCDKSPSGSMLAEDLASFNLLALLEGVLNIRYNFLAQEWSKFFASVQQQSGQDTSIRLQHEHDTFFLGRISKYPPLIRPCIPLMAVQKITPIEVGFVFHLILFGAHQSEQQFMELRRLDQRLLCLLPRVLRSTSNSQYDEALIELCKSRERAGRLCVDGQSYVTVTEQIIGAVCPMPTDDTYHAIRISGIEASFFKYVSPDCFSSIGEHWSWILDGILANTPNDSNLAMFLRERTLQYNSNTDIPIIYHNLTWEKLAEACLVYIQKCGVPFLKHTHLPETTSCIVCAKFPEEAIVVDVLPNEDASVIPPSTHSTADIRVHIDDEHLSNEDVDEPSSYVPRPTIILLDPNSEIPSPSVHTEHFLNNTVSDSGILQLSDPPCADGEDSKKPENNSMPGVAAATSSILTNLSWISTPGIPSRPEGLLHVLSQLQALAGQQTRGAR